MADDSDDKTEAPTPHRKEKAREEGQVPRSKELTSILMLFVGVGVLWMGGDAFARKLSGIMSSGLRFDHGIINDQKMILGHLIALLKILRWRCYRWWQVWCWWRWQLPRHWVAWC